MFYANLIDGSIETLRKQKLTSFANGINVDYDENLLPIRYAKNTFNFDFTDGALKDGIGINAPAFKYDSLDLSLVKNLNYPNSYPVLGCWYFNMWDNVANMYTPYILIYMGDGKIYYNYLNDHYGTVYEAIGMTFEDLPIVTQYNLNGEDVLLIFGEKEGMYVYKPTTKAKKIENVPAISSMAVHYERLFITTVGEKKSIWFSDDLDPTNFNVSSSEGGFIEMVDDFGKLNKVLSFKNYLYVFRDYNIAKVSAFANQNEFSVNQLYVSNGQIFDKSVVVCGNKILFLAQDGIYSFNGNSCAKLSLNIDKMFEGVDNRKSIAGYSDGYYYLACRLNFLDNEKVGCENQDNFVNNALLKINVTTGQLSILRGYDITNINVIKDILDNYVIVVVRKDRARTLGMIDSSGEFFGEPTYKVWESAKTDLGYPDKMKIINEISLDTLADCTIEISYDDNCKKYKLKGKSKNQVIRPYVKGYKIAYKIISNSKNNRISNPEIKVGIV